MGTLFLDQIKKQVRSFLQEKCKTAKLVFTDVTQAELWTEEATNEDPWGPDTRIMTKIAEASYVIDDYWRIVDVLHTRLDTEDWKQWRQAYKTLVLLEFLLTHDPEEVEDEFQCDRDVIEGLGTFQYIDEKDFNWGANMRKRTENLLKLLGGGDILKQARLKALKTTREIQGFGSNSSSPSSSSSTSSPMSWTPDSSRTSFGSSYTTGSSDHEFSRQLSLTKHNILEQNSPQVRNRNSWRCGTIQESGSLLDSDEQDDEGEEWRQKPAAEGFIGGICSKIASLSPSKSRQLGDKGNYRSFSDGVRMFKIKYDAKFLWGIN